MEPTLEKEFAGILHAIEKFTENASRKKTKKISEITPKEELAIRIKKAMVGKKISQRKLAEVMGISSATLNFKINGEYKFSLEEAFLLAKILQVPFDELYFKYPY